MKKWVFIVLLTMMVQPHLAQALVIDEFDGTAVSLIANPSDLFARDTFADSSILGGEREATVAYDIAHSTAADDVELRINFLGQGNASHSQDANVAGLSLFVYDGEADVENPAVPLELDPTGLGGIDLTEGGVSNSFLLSVLFADLAVNDALGLFVYTDATHASQLFLNIPAPVGTPTVFEFAYADFQIADGAAGAADFTNVGAIVFAVDGRFNPGLDVRVDWLRTSVIPEPATLTLIGLGAGLLCMRRRRIA